MFAFTKRLMTSRCLSGRHVLAAVAVALVLAGSCEVATAQSYDSIEAKIDGRAARSLRAQVNIALRNPTAYSSGGSADIDKYFKQYFFPRRTQYNPGALAELGKERETLIKLLRGTTVPRAQEQLTTLTLGAMRVLARGNYHPAVRYNASLVLGLLDQKYPDDNAPVVLSAATNELLELLEAEELDGVKVHPSVKVGALQGLERHVQFGMDAQYADRVTKAALAVLNQEAESLELKEDVNNWMKCQAARVLVRQFKDGPTPEVQAALTALIGNEEMSLDDRCCVAGLLEKIKYAEGGTADIAATVTPMGNLTKAVVDKGAEVAREFEELLLGGNQSFRGRGARGGFGAPGADSGPKLERREFLSRLVLIEQGAKSLSAGLPAEAKGKIESLLALLKPVIEQFEDSRSFDVDLIREVNKLENSVENLVTSWQPAAAAPATEEVSFE